MTLTDQNPMDQLLANVALEDTPTYNFFDIPIFDGPSLALLLIRFGFNLLICWIIIQVFYYKKSGRRDYYFTFLLFSVTIFLLIFLLDNVKLQMGFALGLFAIFGMIRYRTETVPIREMTYLFEIIGISVINGLAMTVSYTEIVVTNVLFLLVTWVLENNNVLKHTASKIILYDKIQNVVPEREKELIEDLKVRTGLEILKVEVGNIDFLRDVAYIKIFYKPLGEDIAAGASAKQLKPEEFKPENF
jgi:hypothetical protein